MSQTFKPSIQRQRQVVSISVHNQPGLHGHLWLHHEYFSGERKKEGSRKEERKEGSHSSEQRKACMFISECWEGINPEAHCVPQTLVTLLCLDHAQEVPSSFVFLSSIFSSQATITWDRVLELSPSSAAYYDRFSCGSSFQPI